ncbi:MAG: 50S ribosomal protein L21 [Deltaproteobacteria bacterium]|nr:50S ribosomal protein L21 [Deltaproteobacteria bacterium]
MYAIIQTGGKQYQVAPGDVIRIESLGGEKGDAVSIPKVLFVAREQDILVGKPYLEGVSVVGEILHQGRDRKILIFKHKRRKGYRKLVGHRQPYTQFKIKEIQGI